LKIAMIGGKTSTAGFGALGVKTFPVAVPSEAPDVWKTMDLAEFAVIFMTEPIYEVLADAVAEVRGETIPVVAVIPAVVGSQGIGMKEMKTLVERAIGVDVIFRE